MEVRTNAHRHLALLLTVGNQRVAYLEHDNGLEMKSAMHAAFEKEFPLVAIHQTTGLEYQAIEYARHYLGEVSKIYTYSEEVVMTLLDIMAAGSEGMTSPVVLLDVSDGFNLLGCYASIEDAKLVAGHSEGIFSMLTGPESFDKEWSLGDVMELRQYLDPSARPDPKAWKGKQLTSTLEGVYKMATTKKVEKKAVAKKVEKVAKERVAKKDGPVAQIHAYLDGKIEQVKSGKLTRQDAAKALEERGISKGTIGVQLGKWATLNKVAFIKPAKPVKEAKPAAKAPAKATTKAPAAKPVKTSPSAPKPIPAAKPAPLKPAPAGKPAGTTSI